MTRQGAECARRKKCFRLQQSFSYSFFVFFFRSRRQRRRWKMLFSQKTGHRRRSPVCSASDRWSPVAGPAGQRTGRQGPAGAQGQGMSFCSFFSVSPSAFALSPTRRRQRRRRCFFSLSFLFLSPSLRARSFAFYFFGIALSTRRELFRRFEGLRARTRER